MLDREKQNYEIIKTNNQGISTVIAVVRGLTAAEGYCRTYKSRLTKEEREAGWGYYHADTTAQVTIPTDRPIARKRSPRK